MPIPVDAALAEKVYGHLTSRLNDTDSRMRIVREYLAGNQRLPYMPRKAVPEFEEMAQRSINNWLPLVSDTFVKRLFVDGYRPSGTEENSAPWEFFQANRLDARQTIVHRGAVEYGTAFVRVLPGVKHGKSMPVITPLSPLNSIAWYNDDDDEFPYLAANRLNDRIDGAVQLELYDDVNVYTFTREATEEHVAPGANDGAGAPIRTLETHDWTLTDVKRHGLGVVPFVRFRDTLDERHDGMIYPLIPDQERINEVVFAIHMALQYGVFRQRYASGLFLETDEAGNVLNPFQAGADRLWVTDQPDAKFGEFAQTQISDHLNAYTKAVQTLAAHGQIDPNLLTGDVINVSSEALGSMQDSTTQRLNVLKMVFGEAWEQVFRLAALAAGDTEAAEDESAQTRWRDDTAHEFLTSVQGLALLVDKLDVPPEALWDKVPGMTDQDVQKWRDAAAKHDTADPMAQLAAALQKQATTPPLPPTQPGQEAPTDGSDPNAQPPNG